MQVGRQAGAHQLGSRFVVILNYQVSAMWFLLQSAIIVATVQSNISYRWAERTAHAVMIGVGLAWIATVIVSGHLERRADRQRNRWLRWE
jgi:hypothetical protein